MGAEPDGCATGGVGAEERQNANEYNAPVPDRKMKELLNIINMKSQISLIRREGFILDVRLLGFSHFNCLKVVELGLVWNE